MAKPVLVIKDPNTGTSKVIEFPITEEQALQAATHRHYKGGLYLELERIPYSEGGVMVIYHHLWPHAPQKWARLATEFDGKLEDGSLRFTPLKQDDRPNEVSKKETIALDRNTKAQMALIALTSAGFTEAQRAEALGFLRDFHLDFSRVPE